MSNIYDVIIIGGGPAGYTAALYAARAGLSTLVLERMSAGGQMALTDMIENYPGFPEGVDGITLGMNMQSGAERFGAKTEYAELIGAELEGNIKTLRTTSGDLSCKTVIAATGADPRKLGLEGEEAYVGRGVHYCAHCDGRFYKGKTVAVVGGGNSAVQDALYLSKLAAKVYLIHRRDTLRAEKIYSEALMRAENVEFLWYHTVKELITDKKAVGAILTDLRENTQKELRFDGLFVSIGRSPSSAPFKGSLTVDEYGYIVADESTKTNVSGVFAAGDVRTKPLRQVATAIADGAVAAHEAQKYIEGIMLS